MASDEGQKKKKILCLHGRRTNTRVIKSFFPQQTIRALRLLAEEQCTWIPGRQGGGYEKIICQLRSPTTHNPTTGSLFASQLVSAEVYRSLCLITNSEARSEAGAASWRHLDEWIRRLPSSAGSDAYFLRCGPGVSVPPHTDPSRPELEHHRLNVVLSTAHEGGDVTIDGARVPSSHAKPASASACAGEGGGVPSTAARHMAHGSSVQYMVAPCRRQFRVLRAASRRQSISAQLKGGLLLEVIQWAQTMLPHFARKC